MFSDFLNNVYGMLFEPKKTIEKLSEKPEVFQSVLLMIFISFFLSILFFGVGKNIFLFLFFSIWICFTSVVWWMLLAAFYELVANIFVQKSKYKSVLCLLSFCLLPWIFMAPLELLKNAGVCGSFIGIYGELALWIWTGVLMFFSLKKVYELKALRAFLFLILPFIAGVVSLNLFISFIVNIVKIFS